MSEALSPALREHVKYVMNRKLLARVWYFDQYVSEEFIIAISAYVCPQLYAPGETIRGAKTLFFITSEGLVAVKGTVLTKGRKFPPSGTSRRPSHVSPFPRILGPRVHLRSRRPVPAVLALLHLLRGDVLPEAGEPGRGARGHPVRDGEAHDQPRQELGACAAAKDGAAPLALSPFPRTRR